MLLKADEVAEGIELPMMEVDLAMVESFIVDGISKKKWSLGSFNTLGFH